MYYLKKQLELEQTIDTPLVSLVDVLVPANRIGDRKQ